jgi:hypothetical protein
VQLPRLHLYALLALLGLLVLLGWGWRHV